MLKLPYREGFQVGKRGKMGRTKKIPNYRIQITMFKITNPMVSMLLMHSCIHAITFQLTYFSHLPIFLSSQLPSLPVPGKYKAYKTPRSGIGDRRSGLKDRRQRMEKSKIPNSGDRRKGPKDRRVRQKDRRKQNSNHIYHDNPNPLPGQVLPKA